MKTLLQWLNKKHIQIVALMSAFFITLGITVGYYFWYVPIQSIYEFNPKRDTQEIIALFESDRYWLTQTPDYSAENMLNYRAPNKNPLYFGKLQIKVLREQDELIGFIAYFMKNKNLGLILFLEVNPAFRGKGYAGKLMRYALNDLRKMGAQRVDLTTRVSNLAAQKTYLKLGFKETHRDDEFLEYSYQW